MDSANQYLLNLRKDKVTAEMEKTWDKEIMDAENKRIADITAMDIMKTRSTASGSDQAAEMDVLEFTSEELWIQLGLDLEEKQWAYSFSIHLDELLICHRIEIQDKVRRLGKDPRDEDRSAIERDRQVLQVQMEIFATKKAELGILEHNIHSPRDALPGAFDDIDNEEQASATIDPAQEPATIPLEHFTLALPSAMPAMIGHPIRNVELRLRILQAARYIQQLQESIAEKSFQYSHVMRKAPRKGVRTRARTAISKLNDRITALSRGYTKSRSALIMLRADEHILNLYKELKKEDLKSSTAILDANIPGSTGITLSWIWQTNAEKDPNSSPEAVRECIVMLALPVIIFHSPFQIFGFTTCVVVLRNIVGKRSTSCFNMRWSGQHDGLPDKLGCGINERYRPTEMH